MELFDLNDPERPAVIARWDPPDATVQRIWCGDDDLYVANFFREFRVFEYPPPFPPAEAGRTAGTEAQPSAEVWTFRMGVRSGRLRLLAQ